MSHKPTLIVVGGGAAGFFCAVNAAANYKNLQVIILEKSAQLLSKVRISGGGRCNVTHACFSIEDLVKQYPRGNHFVKKMLHQFAPQQTIEWFGNRGVRLVTESDGRMFPETNQSATIVTCLLRDADKYGVTIHIRSEVSSIEKTGNKFCLSTTDGIQYESDYVCVAAGGYPKGQQYHWLELLGHSFQPPVPSLFTFNIPNPALRALMGISVSDARVTIADTRFQQFGPLLITHWGLSGPAILKLSAFAARHLADTKYQGKLMVNWLPHLHDAAIRELIQQIKNEKSATKIAAQSPFGIPTRLWHYLLNYAGIDIEKRWADLKAIELTQLIKVLLNSEYNYQGKTTFKEEFVTCGGITLSEVNAQTMESKLVSGLYFCGEILDIDGITGGFNFQQSWAGGWIAAKAIASAAQKKATEISGS
ncbi:MAG: NAD(P)/FAD-dependent oxidoreductase [Sediminibacterium sp.]|nr:NAD(P)/FAD-dependent oxidoreductase [Sediminibacterium sp.]